MIFGKNLALRYLTIDDEADVRAQLADWPGRPFTNSMIRKMLNQCELDHLDVERPAREGLAFRESLAIVEDGVIVGHSVHVVEGLTVEISHQAVLPEFRGKGDREKSVFEEANIILKRYGFEHLGLESVRFPILKQANTLEAHVNNRSMYEPDSELFNTGENEVCFITITKDKYNEYLETSPDKDWPFTFEA